MLEKLEELLDKYESDYIYLRENWHNTEISYTVYQMDAQYIKGEIDAITTAIAYLKGKIDHLI